MPDNETPNIGTPLRCEQPGCGCAPTTAAFERTWCHAHNPLLAARKRDAALALLTDIWDDIGRRCWSDEQDMPDKLMDRLRAMVEQPR